MNLSIVVPLFNEEESLPELVEWIQRVITQNNLSYEIILVDDGSRDNSWAVIEQLSSSSPNVKGISFVRNYGKSAALYVGFEAAKGDVVVTMDADLQDSPDEIPELYRMIAEENYDVVSGWKKVRHDPVSKTVPSKLYNATVRMVTKIKLHDFNSGLKAYKRKVVKSIEVYGEMHRYIPVLAKQAGFNRIGEKVIQHQARKYGKTKFGYSRFINGFLDLFSVVFVSKFGKRPMHFFGLIGTLMFLLGGGITIWLIARKIYESTKGLPFRQVTDQPLFYIALLAVVLGVMLFLAGFLGELIARNSPERNRYLIDKTTNVSEREI